LGQVAVVDKPITRNEDALYAGKKVSQPNKADEKLHFLTFTACDQGAGEADTLYPRAAEVSRGRISVRATDGEGPGRSQ
jgi:hypothetical protein